MEIIEDPEDGEDPPSEPAEPAPRRRGRPRTAGVRISVPAASSRAPSRAHAAAVAPPARAARRRSSAVIEDASEAPNMQAWMSHMERQMQQVMLALRGISSTHGRDQADNYDDDAVSAADETASQHGGSQRRSIPTSDFIPHIPRLSLEWWDNHPAGTPIAYKDLPGQLRQAMDKNPRDRLEVQQAFTALTLAASLLDAFVAVTVEGNLQFAQFGTELILTHLAPLLGRRVDALQQEGALRSVFMSAQDPRSQYFIADPDTSYGILQKVSSARVQALMTTAGRRGGRDEDAERRSTNRRSSSQRQAAGGSPGQPARDRGTANSRHNNTCSSSRRGGGGSRSDSRERRGSSRDGAASKSNPADSSSRAADHK